MEEFKAEFNQMINEVNPNMLYGDPTNDLFGIASTVEGKEPTDVTIALDLGLVKFDSIKIVDYSSLKKGVEFFRPVINGFIGILLGMFYYRELLSFIGQAPNMASAHKKANDDE